MTEVAHRRAGAWCLGLLLLLGACGGGRDASEQHLHLRVFAAAAPRLLERYRDELWPVAESLKAIRRMTAHVASSEGRDLVPVSDESATALLESSNVIIVADYHSMDFVTWSAGRLADELTVEADAGRDSIAFMCERIPIGKTSPLDSMFAYGGFANYAMLERHGYRLHGLGVEHPFGQDGVLDVEDVIQANEAAATTIDAVLKSGYTRAIVIMGIGHCCGYEGSLVSVLQARGLKCALVHPFITELDRQILRYRPALAWSWVQVADGLRMPYGKYVVDFALTGGESLEWSEER